MKTRILFTTIILLFMGFLALVTFILLKADLALLRPQGSVAAEERNLMVIATLLMLIVVIPVFFLTFFFAWRYRASNTKAVYKPNWDHHHIIESIWWGIPIIIIGVLAVITWFTTHTLDPYRPLASDKKPVTVEVVALQWKWLFLYPEQGVASVNYLQIPTDTPINFKITADAPMNSVWIPRLGGQVYAMNGMQTKLHLEANEPGEYEGVSANISGEGFADMKFMVEAVSGSDFESWVSQTRQRGGYLSQPTYDILAEPSVLESPRLFASHDHKLFDTIMMKYMHPEGTGAAAHEGH